MAPIRPAVRLTTILAGLICSLTPAVPALAQPAGGTAATFRVLHSLGDQNRVQTGMIRNVLLLSDGTQALTCGTDGCVCLWDIDRQTIIRRFADEDSIIAYCMALTADEKRLITAGQGQRVNLWDVATGERIRSWAHSNTVFSMAIREDQQSFVFGNSKGLISLQAFDADEPVKTFRDTSDDITALTLLPDGSGFLAGNDQGTVSLWNFDGEEPADSLEGLEGTICCLRFSDDGGQLLGCDYNGNVMLWNAADHKKIWRKKELSGDIVWGHFIDDETIVVVDTDDAFYLLNRDNGQATKKDIKLPAAAGFVLSPDKKVAWCGGNNVLCGWDLETADRVFPSDEGMQLAEGLDHASLLGGRLFTTSGQPTVTVRDLDTGQVVYEIDPSRHQETTWSPLHLLPSADGMIVHSTGGFLVVEPRSGEVLHSREQTNQGLFSATQPRMFAYVEEDNRSVRLHDVLGKRKSRLLRLQQDANGFSKLAMLDEQFLALTNNDYPRELQIWSLPENRIVDRYLSEDYFEMSGAAGALIAGVNNEQRLVVFASPQLDDQPLDPRRFQELLEQLDSPEYRVRNQATRQLMQGGTAVVAQLEAVRPTTAEARMRIERIRGRVNASRLPNLDRPLDGDPRLASNVEVACVDPDGRYVLAAKRKGWQSELLLCRVADEERYEIAGSGDLRSRASLIEPAWQQPDTFVVGYADGTMDVIQVDVPGARLR